MTTGRVAQRHPTSHLSARHTPRSDSTTGAKASMAVSRSGDPETIHGIVLTGHAKADTKPASMKSFHPKISETAIYAKAFEAALR